MRETSRGTSWQHKLPSSVEVGGVDYRLSFYGEEDHRTHNTYGMCDKVHKVIALSPLMREEQAATTVLHEVLHAIVEEYGMDEVVPEGLEEYIVKVMANGLSSALRKKPELLRVLAASEEEDLSFS